MTNNHSQLHDSTQLCSRWRHKQFRSTTVQVPATSRGSSGLNNHKNYLKVGHHHGNGGSYLNEGDAQEVEVCDSVKLLKEILRYKIPSCVLEETMVDTVMSTSHLTK